MKETAAIVLAAGQGSRMRSNIPKQFMMLQGKPVVYYSLKAFIQAGVEQLVLVVSEEMRSYCEEEIVKKYNMQDFVKLVSGGEERYDSVYKGLKEICDASIVMIHDGARPMLTKEMIERSYEGVIHSRACVVGVPVKDTIKVVDVNHVAVETLDRSTLWQMQTPQSFYTADILDAYKKMMEAKDKTITDDAMVMERYGKEKVKIILGDYHNIKITTPEDLELANVFINRLPQNMGK